MPDTTLKLLDADLKKRRQEVHRLRADLEDLEDYLDVLEARRASAVGRKMTQKEVERRYGSK